MIYIYHIGGINLEENKLHNIIMENRNRLSVSGVKDVGAFNEEMIQLSTSMGELIVKGYNLHINKLNIDDGELKIDGEIASLVYEESKGEKESFLSRLFK